MTANGIAMNNLGNGKFSVWKGLEGKLIENVINSDLTDAQKQYFLYDVAGISQQEINKAFNG